MSVADPPTVLEMPSAARVLGAKAQTLAYAAVIAASGVLYTLVTFALRSSTGSSLAGSRYLFATGFVVAIVAGLPLQTALRRQINALLNKERPDRAVTSLLREMEAAADPCALLGRVTRDVARDFGCERVLLLRLSEDEQTFVPAETSGPVPTLEVLETSHPLVRMVSTLHAEVARATLALPRYANMRSACVAVFDALGADVVFPIENGETLVGLLALGWGQLRPVLDEPDLQVLRAITSEIGLCLMRASEVERLRSQKLEMDRLAQFLPENTIEAVLRDELPGFTGRRRRLTVLSCELSGFPASDDSLAPDLLTDLLTEYYTLVGDEASAESGTVARIRGARVVVVFGDPQVLDDHPRRALAVAVRLQQRLHELLARSVGGGEGGASIGIESGVATVGFIYVGARLEYEALGSVVQRAAELGVMAAPGEILIGPETKRVLGDAAQCEELQLVDESAVGRHAGYRVLEFGGRRVLSEAVAARVQSEAQMRVSRGHASLLRAGRIASAPLDARDDKHVFIAYARVEQAFVLGLASALDARGIRVWVDQREIPSGSNWDAAIDHALTACTVFIIVLSPAAVESPEVQGELRVALEEGKVIVPLLRRPCRVPRRLRLVQYIDATSEAEQEAVLDAIIAAIAHGETLQAT